MKIVGVSFLIPVRELPPKVLEYYRFQDESPLPLGSSKLPPYTHWREWILEIRSLRLFVTI